MALAACLKFSCFSPGKFSILSLKASLANIKNSLTPANTCRHGRIFNGRRSSSPQCLKSAGLVSWRLTGLVVGTGLGVASFVWTPVGKCESLKRSQLPVKKQLEDEPEFCWKTFLKLLVPEFWYLLCAVISALVVAYSNIQIPLQLGEVVNCLNACSREGADNYWSLMKSSTLKLLTTYLTQGLFTFLYISLLSHSGERLASRMRTQLFENILKQDMVFFDKNKTGAIIHRLSGDVQEFKSSFKMSISQGLRAFAQIAGSGLALCFVSPSLTGVLLLVVPALVGTGWFLGSHLRSMSRKSQEQTALATAIADEAFGNVRTVRAFAMEDKEIELFNSEISQSCRMQQKLGYSIGAFQGLTNIALNGMILGVLVAGGSLLADSRLTPGELMSFLVSAQTIQKSLGQLSIIYGYVIRGMSSGARVFEYMKLVPSLSTSDDGVKIPYHALHGNIEFKDISFHYPTRHEQQVLTDLSLSVPAGKTLALVGLSGGGKSTLALLLQRFYDPQHGQITIDGVDIKTCSPKWLRGRCIGFISQEPVLFATSVMENIRYGRPGATDAEVKEAAMVANAHTFIQNFPDGYSTILGERGVTVSGGQKQRIAIARALLQNPSIMILDEATSALDAESEKVVQEALDKAVNGRTVIVIAHRLSTVKNADNIAVVLNGQIAEVGSHEKLIKKKGAYWKLVTHQYTSPDEF